MELDGDDDRGVGLLLEEVVGGPWGGSGGPPPLGAADAGVPGGIHSSIHCRMRPYGTRKRDRDVAVGSAEGSGLVKGVVKKGRKQWKRWERSMKPHIGTRNEASPSGGRGFDTCWQKKSQCDKDSAMTAPILGDIRHTSGWR